MKTEFLISEGAELVGCHADTLRRLNRKGLLPAKRNYLGFRVFRLEDLLKLKRRRQELGEGDANG